MKIIIHRGTQQIGGCVTEIRSDKARIFIDMGSELPDENGNTIAETLAVEGVTTGEKNCDAVFFTHYHGDHVGMLSRILPGIPLYMGEAAKEIYLVLQKRLKSPAVPVIESIVPFEVKDKIQIGDITVTPLRTDHSAYDSYMFLIESGGKKILHTGDFRLHGFCGKGTIPMLKEYAKDVDVLITEGTMLSRGDSVPETEHELQKKATAWLKEYKYVFLLCSSTNIDRLASFNRTTPRGKYFLCDSYQKDVLEVAKKYGAKHTPLYAFEKVTVYGKNLDEQFEKRGFCMPVRASTMFPPIVQKYKEKYNADCLMVYSMWEGYLKQPDSELNALMDGFQNVEHLHTSGHASKQAIIDVCNVVAPKQAVIPIHGENPEVFKSLGLPFHIECLQDGEIYTL